MFRLLSKRVLFSSSLHPLSQHTVRLQHLSNRWQLLIPSNKSTLYFPGAGSAIGQEDSAPQFDAPVPRPYYTLFPMPKCRTLTSRASGDG
jgi:hypothetical protein